MKLSKKYYSEQNGSGMYDDWDESLLAFFNERNNVSLPVVDRDFEEISVTAKRNRGIRMCFDKNNGEFVKCRAFYNQSYSREDVRIMVEEALRLQYDMMKAGYIE